MYIYVSAVRKIVLILFFPLMERLGSRHEPIGELQEESLSEITNFGGMAEGTSFASMLFYADLAQFIKEDVRWIALDEIYRSMSKMTGFM